MHHIPQSPLISLVVPVYNEADNLPLFASRVLAMSQNTGLRFECVFVNDGSKDDSSGVLESLHREYSWVNYLELSRNFGQQPAIAAGLKYARGHLIAVMDADLQDPPELIPEMFEKIKSGADVAYGVRVKREKDSWFKKLTAGGYYRFMRSISKLDLPPDAGDFRLITRQVLNALHQLEDHHRLFRTQVAWLGFRQEPVYFKRPARHAGKSGFTYGSLLKMGIDGITAFASAPLRWPLHAAAIMLMIQFLFLIAVFSGAGYTDPFTFHSLMLIVLGTGVGILLLFAGIFGEYLSRINIEVRKRPAYIVKSIHFNEEEV